MLISHFSLAPVVSNIVFYLTTLGIESFVFSQIVAKYQQNIHLINRQRLVLIQKLNAITLLFSVKSLSMPNIVADPY